MAVILTRGGLQSIGTAKQIAGSTFKTPSRRSGGGSGRGKSLRSQRAAAKREAAAKLERERIQQEKDAIILEAKQKAARDIQQTQDLNKRRRIVQELKERVNRIQATQTLQSTIPEKKRTRTPDNLLTSRIKELASQRTDTRSIGRKILETPGKSFRRTRTQLKQSESIPKRIRADIEEANILSKEAALNQGSFIETVPQQFADPGFLTIDGTEIRPIPSTSFVEDIRNKFNALPEPEKNKANSRSKQLGINLKRATLNTGAGVLVGLAITGEAILRTPEFVSEVFLDPTGTAAGTVEYAATVAVKLGSGNPFLVGEASGEILGILLTDRGIEAGLRVLKRRGLTKSRVKSYVDDIANPEVKSTTLTEETISKRTNKVDNSILENTKGSSSVREIIIEVPSVSGGVKARLEFIEYVKDGVSIIEGVEKVNGRVTRKFLGDARIIGKRKFTNIIEKRFKKYNPNLLTEVAIRRYVSKINDRLKIEGLGEALITETGRLPADIITTDPVRIKQQRIVLNNIQKVKQNINNLRKQLSVEVNSAKQVTLRRKIKTQQKKLRDLEIKSDRIFTAKISDLDAELVGSRRRSSRDELAFLEQLEKKTLMEIIDPITIERSQSLAVKRKKPLFGRKEKTFTAIDEIGSETMKAIDDVNFLDKSIERNIFSIDIEADIPTGAPKDLTKVASVEAEILFLERGISQRLPSRGKVGKTRKEIIKEAARKERARKRFKKDIKEQQLTKVEKDILKEVNADIKSVKSSPTPKRQRVERSQTTKQVQRRQTTRTRQATRTQFVDDSVFSDIARQSSKDLLLLDAPANFKTLGLTSVGVSRKLSTKQKQSLQLKQRSALDSDLDTLNRTEQAIDQEYNSLFRSAQQQESKQRTRLARSQRAELDSDLDIDFRFTDPELELFPIPLKKKRKKVKKKKVVKRFAGYDVLFKKPKTKKFVKINRNPRSKGRAKDVRDYLIDNSVARSGKIRKSTRKVTKKMLKKRESKIPSGYSRKIKRKMRHGIIRKGKFKKVKGLSIEKEVHLIDTLGEKRGLSAFNVAKRKKIKKKKVKKRIKPKTRNGSSKSRKRK